MKKAINDLALFGGDKLFMRIMPVGQINLPEWEDFVDSMSGIFERRYYTNYGPLERELEEGLRALVQTEHVVMMTNATIGITLAAQAMGLPKGSRVIVPAFTFAATVQALSWAGLEPIFCDIDENTHSITADTVRPYIGCEGVSAVLGVHLWGNACDIEGLELLAADKGIKVFYDAAHAVGCRHNNRAIGGFGACEVFSLHATKVLNSAEGGFVSTNDGNLAEILRNMRSSYGHRQKISVDISGNGRVSEAQAAMGLLGLKAFPQLCAQNKKRYELYGSLLQNLPGISMMNLHGSDEHNYQYLVFEVDESGFGLSRDLLVKILHAENVMARRYFVPGMHRTVPYSFNAQAYEGSLPVTDKLCEKVMQLPSGQTVCDDDVLSICSLLWFIHSNAVAIKAKLL